MAKVFLRLLDFELILLKQNFSPSPSQLDLGHDVHRTQKTRTSEINSHRSSTKELLLTKYYMVTSDKDV